MSTVRHLATTLRCILSLHDHNKHTAATPPAHTGATNTGISNTGSTTTTGTTKMTGTTISTPGTAPTSKTLPPAAGEGDDPRSLALVQLAVRRWSTLLTTAVLGNNTTNNNTNSSSSYVHNLVAEKRGAAGDGDLAREKSPLLPTNPSAGSQQGLSVLSSLLHRPPNNAPLRLLSAAVLAAKVMGNANANTNTDINTTERAHRAISNPLDNTLDNDNDNDYHLDHHNYPNDTNPPSEISSYCSVPPLVAAAALGSLGMVRLLLSYGQQMKTTVDGVSGGSLGGSVSSSSSTRRKRSERTGTWTEFHAVLTGGMSAREVLMRQREIHRDNNRRQVLSDPRAGPRPLSPLHCPGGGAWLWIQPPPRSSTKTGTEHRHRGNVLSALMRAWLGSRSGSGLGGGDEGLRLGSRVGSELGIGDGSGGLLDISVIDLTRRGRVWVSSERPSDTTKRPVDHGGHHLGTDSKIRSYGSSDDDEENGSGSWVPVPSALEMLAASGHWHEVVTILTLGDKEARVGIHNDSNSSSSRSGQNTSVTGLSSLSSLLAAAYPSVQITPLVTPLVKLLPERMEATQLRPPEATDRFHAVGANGGNESSTLDDHRPLMAIPLRSGHTPTARTDHNHTGAGRVGRTSNDGATEAEKCHMLLHCAAADQRADIFGTAVWLCIILSFRHLS